MVELREVFQRTAKVSPFLVPKDRYSSISRLLGADAEIIRPLFTTENVMGLKGRWKPEQSIAWKNYWHNIENTFTYYQGSPSPYRPQELPKRFPELAHREVQNRFGGLPPGFSVSLGGGFSLEGAAFHGTLYQLAIRNSQGDSHSLLRSGFVVLAGFEDSDMSPYLTADGKIPIRWIGPRSKLELIDYLHELGHSYFMDTLTPSQKDLGRRAYALFFKAQKEKFPITTNEVGRVILAHETAASNHALWTIQNLRKQGFDLLYGVPNPHVELYTSMALRTYVDGVRSVTSTGQ